MTESDYLTTADVAQMLRTSAETVRYWRHIKTGPKSFKVGRRVLYARQDVEGFIATSRGAVGEVAQTAPNPVTANPASIVCPHCGHGIEITVQEVQ